MGKRQSYEVCLKAQQTIEFLQLADGTNLDADITASTFFPFLFLVLDGGSDTFLPFPSCWIPEMLTN